MMTKIAEKDEEYKKLERKNEDYKHNMNEHNEDEVEGAGVQQGIPILHQRQHQEAARCPGQRHLPDRPGQDSISLSSMHHGQHETL